MEEEREEIGRGSIFRLADSERVVRGCSDQLRGSRPHSETCLRSEMGCISVSKSGARLGLTGLRDISKSPVLCWGSEEKHLGEPRSWGRIRSKQCLVFPPL